MRHIANIFFKGLGAGLPIILTLVLLFWLIGLLEQSLRPVILLLVPEEGYIVGMGFIAGLVLIFLLGLLVDAWVVQKVLLTAENQLERIPLIKTIYGGIRDLISYFSQMEKKRKMIRVVSVTIAEARLIGFLTGKASDIVPGEEALQGLVSVYLPMSYQVGGYTVYVRREAVVPIVDLSFEDAMRLILTAGLSTSGSRPE